MVLREKALRGDARAIDRLLELASVSTAMPRRSDRPAAVAPMTKPSSLPMWPNACAATQTSSRTALTIESRGPLQGTEENAQMNEHAALGRAAYAATCASLSGRASRPYCRAHPICRTGISTPSSIS